jgi:hypothetical protein
MRTLLPILLLTGCGSQLACGPGTFEQDNLCLPEVVDPPVDTDVPVVDTVEDTVEDTIDTLTDTPDTTDSVDSGDPADTVDTTPVGLPPFIGDLTIVDDGGMVAFCALHDTVYGTVEVRGALVMELTDLACLRQVVGNLVVAAPSLLSLNLPALERVEGSVTLSGTSVALTISMPRLTNVSGSLILDNPEGMQNLVSLDLRALRSVGVDLRIDDSIALYDIELPALTTVGRHLWFRRHSQVGTVSTPRLRTLGGALRVEDNPAITDIAMPALADLGTAVSAELAIEDNAVLADLSGLSAVRTVSGSLVIRGNGAMPQATADAFHRAMTGIGGATVITPNGP